MICICQAHYCRKITTCTPKMGENSLETKTLGMALKVHGRRNNVPREFFQCHSQAINVDGSFFLDQNFFL